MGNDSLEKAIYSATNHIRKVQTHTSIVRTVAEKYGLSESRIKKHLDHLVETGAVFITVTERCDLYFIFDPENIGEGENDSQYLIIDDLSLDGKLESSLKLSESEVLVEV